MRGKEQKKQKEQTEQKWWSFDRVLSLLSVAFTSIPVLQSLKSNEISQRSFNAVALIPIIIAVSMISIFGYTYYKERKVYKNNLERLRKYAKSNETARTEFGYWKNEFKEEFSEKIKKNILVKVKVVFLALIVLVATCIFYPQNAHAFWSGILGIEIEENEKTDIIEVGEEDSEEIVQEERDMQWRFVLDKPAYSFALETQMQNQVYFYPNKEFSEWVIFVQETVKQWKEEQKEGVNYKTVKDDLGNNYFDYTNSEDNFKAEVEYASQFVYYDEWLEHAPHSSEYDQCMSGRENLNKIEVEGAIGCYEIWWKLANDYLYYAQEYERQTEDADAILFYYTKSIYCCIEALKYSLSEDEYNRVYHFLVMRYHDICRDECIILQEYKTRASIIYSILVESDVLRNVGENSMPK